MSGRWMRGVLSGIAVLGGTLLCSLAVGCRTTSPEDPVGPIVHLDCGVDLTYGVGGFSLASAIGTDGVPLFGAATGEDASRRPSWLSGSGGGPVPCAPADLRAVPGAKGGLGVAYDLVDGDGIAFARVRESAFCLPGDPAGARVLGVVRRFEVTSLRTGPTELFVDVLGSPRTLHRNGMISSGPPQWDEGVLRGSGRSASNVYRGEGCVGYLMLLWSRPPCLVGLGDDPEGYLEVTLGETPIRFDVASVRLPDGSRDGEMEVFGLLD